MNKKELQKNKNRIYVVHYASSSINEATITITSVTFLKLDTKNSETFSLVNCRDEKELLRKTFDFFSDKKDYIFAAWNCKNRAYGCSILSDTYSRYFIDDPKKILNIDNWIDVDDLIEKEYTKDYVPHPKLENLSKKNDMTMKDFMDGNSEAISYENKEYKKIELSNARKTYIIAEILSRLFDGSLIVKNNNLSEDNINNFTQISRKILSKEVEHYNYYFNLRLYSVVGIFVFLSFFAATFKEYPQIAALNIILLFVFLLSYSYFNVRVEESLACSLNPTMLFSYRVFHLSESIKTSNKNEIQQDLNIIKNRLLNEVKKTPFGETTLFDKLNILFNYITWERLLIENESKKMELSKIIDDISESILSFEKKSNELNILIDKISDLCAEEVICTDSNEKKRSIKEKIINIYEYMKSSTLLQSIWDQIIKDPIIWICKGIILFFGAMLILYLLKTVPPYLGLDYDIKQLISVLKDIIAAIK